MVEAFSYNARMITDQKIPVLYYSQHCAMQGGASRVARLGA